MWESRYRDDEGHAPDGVQPHPLVMEQAQALIAQAKPTGRAADDLRAVDLGSGPGRHAVALAELGMQVTAVDFAASAHELLRREATERGVADHIAPVVADVSSWQPADASRFDLVVAAYLHTDLEVLINSAHLLAPGGRLIWIAHAPDSPHGPPPEVIRDSLADYRRQLDRLDGSKWQVLRLDEYQLNAEFLDIITIVERSTS
ncbi:type 12 methyltransferase [Corynebacterium halotolerans YIM 70093 = DSM 44683]|uniref:Type 12 methyltransferase n=2 Tax=Corynebacterium halotolerans TaxID=225326 RepID=M1NNL8_9CORY|nr:type 12 methyltransferase [Corynebacterium halotolerans YIM 70093 = DSM 44683]